MFRNGVFARIAMGLVSLALGACASHAAAVTSEEIPAITLLEQSGSGTQAAPTVPSGFVRRSGTHLVDGMGTPLKLTGVNLGGWLGWQTWMWWKFGLSGATETPMMKRFAELLGPVAAERFRVQVYDNFVTQMDIDAVAALGFNVVRVPFNHLLLEDDSAPYRYKKSGWAILDRLLGWAEATGLYVVLALEETPCGQSWYADPDSTLLWDSPACQDRTVKLWRAIAQRYSGRTIVAGYDLMNEPEPPDGAALLDFYGRIIDGIRQVDANHLIVLEGGKNAPSWLTGPVGTLGLLFGWGHMAQDFSIFSGRLDENQAYSFHQYTWFGEDAAADLDLWIDVARAHDVPLWNGEFGENTYDTIAATAALYGDRSELDGWAFWTWKKAENASGYPYLIGFETTPTWEKVMAWVASPTLYPKPSKAEAEQGVAEFIDAIRFANNTLDATVKDALRGEGEFAR